MTNINPGTMALNIDDLLAPLPEVPRLGGSGPFVINLSASATPVNLPEGEVTAHEHATVYQVQRTEDRRVRYRLRFGPFPTEDEAIAILDTVRAVYPTALTATADADDLRAIAASQAKAQSRKGARKSPTVVLQRSVPAAAAPPLSSAPVAPAAPAPVAPLVPAAPPPLPAAKAAAAATSPPVLSLEQMVCRPAQTSQSELTRTGRGKPPQAAVRETAATKAAPRVAVAPVAAPVPAPAAPPKPTNVAPAHPAAPTTAIAGRFDTTQTVRPLTRAELEDAKDWRWFVIELSLSEKPFDPDAVPNLDIYRLYRLYCVAARDGDRVLYALRLGFFSEEVGAKAVANYLAAHYDNPTIKRVSAAERERFSAQRLEARKEVGASGRHAAIEITNERYVR
jgi:hypothetical protein